MKNDESIAGPIYHLPLETSPKPLFFVAEVAQTFGYTQTTTIKLKLQTETLREFRYEIANSNFFPTCNISRL